MNANPSRQKAHNGSILRSPTRRHDLTDAGSDRVISISSVMPSATVLISAMIAVGKQSFRLIMRLVIVEPLAMNEWRIQRNVHENMNRSGHVRVHETNKLVIARFREGYREGGSSTDACRSGNTCAAVEPGAGPQLTPWH